MSKPVSMPEPPYYAVIFSSRRSGVDAGYPETAARMMALAAEQAGFLGMESPARDSDGFGITVSYWSSLEAIGNWKRHAEHVLAQRRGRELWYRDYTVRIARVERTYSFTAGV